MQRMKRIHQSILARSTCRVEQFKEHQAHLIALLDTQPLTATLKQLNRYLTQLKQEERTLSNAYVVVPVQEQTLFERTINKLLNEGRLKWRSADPPGQVSPAVKEAMDYAEWLLEE